MYFQEGNLEIQHTDFLVQALHENQNANKYKLKIQKCFCYFQISAIVVHSCISVLTVLPFLSEWLFLKVDVVDATQFCLDHIVSCARVIHSVVLRSHTRMCLDHNTFAWGILRCRKNDFQIKLFFNISET